MAGLFESRATPAASGRGFAVPSDLPWPGTDTGGDMTLVSPTLMHGKPTLVPKRRPINDIETESAYLDELVREYRRNPTQYGGNAY